MGITTRGSQRSLPVRWLRRNYPYLAVALLVAIAVFAAGRMILAIADQEDTLREAEVGLAELSTLSGALRDHPRNVVDRGTAVRSDVEVNARLRAATARAAAVVSAHWTDPLAEAIRREAVVAAAMSERTIRLAQSGPAGAASQSLEPLSAATSELGTQVASARLRLGETIAADQSTTQRTVYGICGVLALGLLFLILWAANWRRRQLRSEGRQEALSRSEARLRALVRHGSDVIAVLAPDSEVLFCAGAGAKILGQDPEELVGECLSKRVHEDDVPSLLALCAGADGGSGRELRLRHHDGTYRPCEVRANSLLDEQTWSGIVLNVWDIGERKELEDRLRHQAFNDSLTGLANRVLFGERLEHALVRGLRGRDAVAVLLIDLDDFKSINDSLGHPVGDRMLEEVGRRLDEAMRGADTVARLGGDEFAVILDGAAGPSEDEAAARRVLEAIAVPFDVGGGRFPITASVGLASAGPGEASAEQLVRDADLAMYAAKSTQKGSFAVYRPDMHIATEERLQLKADLVGAIAEGQLELHYQPVVLLDSGDVAGLEALLRWNHPDRGLLAPGAFIALAEETGAIVEIGRWVLREACRQGREWMRRLGRNVPISVNVSARQLRAPDLAGHVRDALAEFDFPAELLVLEVTETQLVQNVEQASAVLGEIRATGVRIAIDDFGTGYSSLSQLERLPVDILKVDREFVDTAADPEHVSLLRAVIDIGAALNLRTVAEGIETSEQLEHLRALDYPLGQGYLFSRPLPAAEAERVLRERLAGGDHEAPGRSTSTALTLRR